MRSPQGDVAEAGPSLAVQMLGLNGVPQAGDEFTVYESEADARVAGAPPRRPCRPSSALGGSPHVCCSPAPLAPSEGGPAPVPRSSSALARAACRGALAEEFLPEPKLGCLCPPAPAAEAVEAARRLERLAEMSGGGNRVTLSSLASIDEDGDQQVQQRLSIILKASRLGQGLVAAAGRLLPRLGEAAAVAGRRVPTGQRLELARPGSAALLVASFQKRLGLLLGAAAAWLCWTTPGPWLPRPAKGCASSRPEQAPPAPAPPASAAALTGSAPPSGAPPPSATHTPLPPLPATHPCLQADASGSVEAVRSALGALPQEAVMLRYLLAAPGEITTSDVDLAAASGGMVLGFNVTTSEAVQVGGAAPAPLLGLFLRAHVLACAAFPAWLWQPGGGPWLRGLWACPGWRVLPSQRRVPARLRHLRRQASPHATARPPPSRPRRPPPSARASSCAPTASSTTSSTTSGQPWRGGSSRVSFRAGWGPWSVPSALPWASLVAMRQAETRRVVSPARVTGRGVPASILKGPPHAPSPRPAVEERVSIGTAEVKAVFGSGNRKVAGCLVTDGQLRRDAIAVVKRGKRVVGEVRPGSGRAGGRLLRRRAALLPRCCASFACRAAEQLA